MSEFPNFTGSPQPRPSHPLQLQDMREPPECIAVPYFIYLRHNIASTWTLCPPGSFKQTVHDSFDWIGEMFMYETCAHTGEEPSDSLMLWFESGNQSYAPAVAAFQTLRALLETALPMLQTFQERSRTIQLLQSDVNEIVAKMLAEPTLHPQNITPAASACIHSLLSRLHSCT